MCGVEAIERDVQSCVDRRLPIGHKGRLRTHLVADPRRADRLAELAAQRDLLAELRDAIVLPPPPAQLRRLEERLHDRLRWPARLAGLGTAFALAALLTSAYGKTSRP